MEKELAYSTRRGWTESQSWKYVQVPWMVTTLAFFLTCLIGLSVASLFLPWQQSSNGTGRVIAYAPDERVQNIESAVEGRILRWHVFEGSAVKAGDPIVDIVDIDPNIMDRLERELSAANQKVDAAEKALEFSKRNLDRQKGLAGQGLSSQRAYELAELEYAKLLSDLSSATSEFAKVQVRMARQAAQGITAPRDGIIQRILSTQGGAIVHAGDVIATLVPATESRAVEALVDGNDVPLISVGRKVRVQFEGWPAVQFVGWPSIAVGTFGGMVKVIDPADDGTGRFRVIVFPDPDDAPWPETAFLRQGVRSQIWILLDQVKLGYELWRRFNGFPQSIHQPFSKSDEKTEPAGKKKGKTDKAEEKSGK